MRNLGTDARVHDPRDPRQNPGTPSRRGRAAA